MAKHEFFCRYCGHEFMSGGNTRKCPNCKMEQLVNVTMRGKPKIGQRYPTIKEMLEMKTVTKKIVEGLKTQDQVGIEFPWFYYYEGDEGEFVISDEDIAEAAKKYGIPEDLIRSIVRGVAERTHEFAKAVVEDLSALWLRMDDLEDRAIMGK